MCRAIATYPSANSVSAIVANRKPAGVPRPLPNPTAIGTLPVMAVIGAALATAMKMTATMPMAPFFRPAGGAVVGSTASDSVVTRGLLIRIRVHEGPATLQSAVSLAPLGHPDNRRTPGRNTSGRAVASERMVNEQRTVEPALARSLSQQRHLQRDHYVASELHPGLAAGRLPRRCSRTRPGSAAGA